MGHEAHLGLFVLQDLKICRCLAWDQYLPLVQGLVGDCCCRQDQCLDPWDCFETAIVKSHVLQGQRDQAQGLKSRGLKLDPASRLPLAGRR